MTPCLITSAHNLKVKQLIKLRERKERDRTKRFLIEGFREVWRAMEGGAAIEALFFCYEFFLGSNEEDLIEKLSQRGVSLFNLSKTLFQKVSYRDRPDGILAVGMQEHKLLSDLPLGKVPFLVVAEAIEKPGNLGTILRTCDGVGANGLIVCDRCTDIYNPNTVRASVGTLFTVSTVESTSYETISFLKQHNISIIAACPDSKCTYSDADLTGPIAIALGTEQLGLSAQWKEAADLTVSIPMKGCADSLNVAVASALLLYEVLRQRSL